VAVLAREGTHGFRRFLAPTGEGVSPPTPGCEELGGCNGCGEYGSFCALVNKAQSHRFSCDRLAIGFAAPSFWQAADAYERP
jgi:hypothetical protein